MRISIIGLGAIVIACAGTAPAVASAHHEKASSHRTAKHSAHPRYESRQPSAPGGATSVPPAGIKLYCGPGRSPLMIRKMTQGSGTTVTVICR